VKNSKETQGSQKQKWMGKIGENNLRYLIYLTLVCFLVTQKETSKPLNKQTTKQTIKKQKEPTDL